MFVTKAGSPLFLDDCKLKLPTIGFKQLNGTSTPHTPSQIFDVVRSLAELPRDVAEAGRRGEASHDVQLVDLTSDAHVHNGIYGDSYKALLMTDGAFFSFEGHQLRSRFGSGKPLNEQHVYVRQAWQPRPYDMPSLSATYSEFQDGSSEARLIIFGENNVQLRMTADSLGKSEIALYRNHVVNAQEPMTLLGALNAFGISALDPALSVNPELATGRINEHLAGLSLGAGMRMVASFIPRNITGDHCLSTGEVDQTRGTIQVKLIVDSWQEGIQVPEGLRTYFDQSGRDHDATHRPIFLLQTYAPILN